MTKSTVTAVTTELTANRETTISTEDWATTELTGWAAVGMDYSEMPATILTNGGAEDDYLNGGAGDDTMHGVTGRDYLRGEQGNDNSYWGY